VVRGDAGAFAFPDACFDAAVATQVVEYVDDVDGVIGELRRVLRAGGRLVLLDTDWDTLVWSERHEARARRILDTWHGRAPHTRLPRTLGPRLRAFGFELDRVFVLTLLSTACVETTYSYNLAGLIVHYVRGHDPVAEAELDAWLAELVSLDEVGATSSASTATASKRPRSHDTKPHEAPASVLNSDPAERAHAKSFGVRFRFRQGRRWSGRR
jgi:SAM-dependent methyltransferase